MFNYVHKTYSVFTKFIIRLTVSVMSSNFVNFPFNVSTRRLNVRKN